MTTTKKKNYHTMIKYIYMLFAGREVRMVKNCDLGLENEVTVFHHTDWPLASK